MQFDLQFACRFSRKVFYNRSVQIDNPLLIKCIDKQQLKSLDRLLDCFCPRDFLPHSLEDDGSKNSSPIIITERDCNNYYKYEPNIFMNLCFSIDLGFSSFNRVIEIVTRSDEAKKFGRSNYQFYRERGYEVINHDVSKLS